MATFRFKRQQLEGLFGDDYDGIINFELMLQGIADIEDQGLGAPSIALGTSYFNGLFDATTTTLQIMADIVDDINTSEVPELGNLYYTDERVDDRVATFIQDGTGITWAYDDAGGTLTGTVTLTPFTTDDLAEGSTNLYYTETRVGDYIEANILTYGYEEVTASTTVTKTKTNFSGSTTGQTITLPTAGTAGREVEIFNTGSVKVTLSGSSVLGELYANESACFTDTGLDWVA